MRQPTNGLITLLWRVLLCAVSLLGGGSVQAVKVSPHAKPLATTRYVDRFATIWSEKYRRGPTCDTWRSCAKRRKLWGLSPAPQTALSHRAPKPKIFEPKSGTDFRIGRRAVVTTLYNIHTREALPLSDGRAPVGELFDELTRCRGFGERKTIDPRLLEAVVAAARHFSVSKVEVISAYRSQKFNDALAKKGRHVAVRSKHIEGKAIDVTFVGAPAADVGDWLWQTFDGGVGVYRVNNFVHIDVGPKRRWFGQ